MGNYYSGSLCHLYTTIGQASVQERAFLDADPLFLQRIEHCRQTSEIEIFPLENQVVHAQLLSLVSPCYLEISFAQKYQITTIWKYFIR